MIVMVRCNSKHTFPHHNIFFVPIMFLMQEFVCFSSYIKTD